jgi:hypothetical protein
MESDGQSYAGPSAESFQQPRSSERITSTCTIKNGSATCF